MVTWAWLGRRLSLSSNNPNFSLSFQINVLSLWCSKSTSVVFTPCISFLSSHCILKPLHISLCLFTRSTTLLNLISNRLSKIHYKLHLNSFFTWFPNNTASLIFHQHQRQLFLIILFLCVHFLQPLNSEVFQGLVNRWLLFLPIPSLWCNPISWTKTPNINQRL